MEAFPVRRVLTPADFADAEAWMETRTAVSPDRESGTIRVLAVHGDFHVEGRDGFPRALYATAHAVSFVDMSARTLELVLDIGEGQARFGFDCLTRDPAYAARANLTSLFPELERYVAQLWGRRIGYRTYDVGHAELQNMIFEYCAIRPPGIRGIRARLAYLDLTQRTEG